ncbi:hypothetical protein CXG81DRAFT_7088, partial [Caulochytrium protostelioides]
PFDAFAIDPLDLPFGHARAPCPQCQRSSSLYCPVDMVALPQHVPAMPRVDLPIPLDVYRHPRELPGKSTALQAQLLAPGHVRTFVEDVVINPGYEQVVANALDRYADPSRVLLLYPCEGARSLSELPRQSYDRLIVLDGTWRQGKSMARAFMESGRGFVPVRINQHDTLFWRFQAHGTDHLSTIEAIYWFYREYAEVCEPHRPTNRYDNLLFFFARQWRQIQSYYRDRPQLRFTHR